MDGNHPKWRKDKYNPYTIGTTGDGRHWLTFSDGQRNRHHLEIDAAVFALFDSFELDDLSYLNEVDRHYEQSELTEASLYDRAVHRPATVEESALQSMEYAQLHRAISELPEIQKRRLILYYFQGLTYEQIAGMEGCTFQAVAKSVAAAEKRLKNIFGIGGWKIAFKWGNRWRGTKTLCLFSFSASRDGLWQPNTHSSSTFLLPLRKHEPH
jgi:RNA polymerase sigma factor (sigma-70 family)